MKEFLKKYPRVKAFLVKYHPIHIVYFFKSIFALIVRLFDFIYPTESNYYGFPVHFYTHTFSDSTRAIYEQVKNDSRIVKVIFVRSKNIRSSLGILDSSTILVEMNSIKGFMMLLKCKTIFIQHSVWLDFAPFHFAYFRLISLSKRKVVNLWHGIPIKSIMADSTGLNFKSIEKEKKHYIITASSFNDKLVMIGAFYPIKPANVLVTGIARNDFILMDEHLLPDYCKAQLNLLRTIVNGKKLIVYAPTYREVNLGGENYTFAEDEVILLKKFLKDNNAILGFRLHYYNRTTSYVNLFDNEHFIDLDQEMYPDMAMIIRESELVVSDYSGLVVDTIYANKPVICFGYDLEHYGSKQRGFIYPIDLIFPNAIAKNFIELLGLLEKCLGNEIANNGSAKGLFFENFDADNSLRILNAIR